jgi:hypothetical protein
MVSYQIFSTGKGALVGNIVAFLAIIFQVLADSNIAEDIAALTGHRTRLVWARDTGAGAPCPAGNTGCKLYAFDTDDGRGEREIELPYDAYYSARLTAEGNRIVYTSGYNLDVYIVNWDGTGNRKLFRAIRVQRFFGSGFAGLVSVRERPVSGFMLPLDRLGVN